MILLDVAEGVEEKREEGALAAWDRPWQRAGVLAALWVAFLVGSLLGAILVS